MIGAQALGPSLQSLNPNTATASCVILGELLNLSIPFLHLSNG